MTDNAIRRPIFLIGFPGSGKSTLGESLRRLAGIVFVDLDDAIANDARMSVPEIFAAEGEAGFRRRERLMLEQLATTRADIVACGGGTPCQPGNMQLINSLGTSVWLDAGFDKLFARLALGRHERPLIARLDDNQLREYISRVMAERTPFYAQAHHRFSADELDSPEQLAHSVQLFRQKFSL